MKDFILAFITKNKGGEITVWNDNSKRLESFSGLHQATVSALAWSSNGSRLITGDLNGLIAVWKTDANGKLVQPPILQFSVESKVNEILNRPTSTTYKDVNKELHELAKAAIDGDESALEMFDYRSPTAKGNKKNKLDTRKMFAGSSEALSFLISCNNGVVYHINESLKYNTLFKLDTGIAKLLYNQEKSMIIAVTNDQILAQYILKEDYFVKNLMTVI